MNHKLTKFTPKTDIRSIIQEVTKPLKERFDLTWEQKGNPSDFDQEFITKIMTDIKLRQEINHSIAKYGQCYISVDTTNDQIFSHNIADVTIDYNKKDKSSTIYLNIPDGLPREWYTADLGFRFIGRRTNTGFVPTLEPYTIIKNYVTDLGIATASSVYGLPVLLPSLEATMTWQTIKSGKKS